MRCGSLLAEGSGAKTTFLTFIASSLQQMTLSEAEINDIVQDA